MQRRICIIEKGAFWQINQLSPESCRRAISLNRGKVPLVDSTADAALMTLVRRELLFLAQIDSLYFTGKADI